jgi:hypothetical protein
MSLLETQLTFRTRQKKPQFLYINVFFNDFKVAALVDSGSSINIMSKTLFDSIPDQYKLSFERLECSEIRLANNETTHPVDRL